MNMKKYIVQKAMRFDKSYQKGEEIPENVIAKDMINKLLRCGVLAVIEVAEIKETNEITEEQQQEETSKITEEEQQEETSKITEEEQQEETSQISEEEQQEETSQISEEEQQKISLQTKEQLLQYKKEELEQMAEQKGIEVKQGMTKTDIVELLLQKE